MKKTALAGILLLIFSLISLSAFAQGFCFPPYPVFGKATIFGVPAGHITLSVDDTRFGKTFTQETDINSNGEYSLDLGNFENCYFTGMKGRLSICDAVECKFDFTVSSEGKVKRDFLVTTLTPIPVPSGTTVIVRDGGGSGGGGGGSVPQWTCQEWTVCKDGKQSRECTQAEFKAKSTETKECIEPIVVPPPIVTPPIEPQLYTCSDGTKVANKADCPVKSKEHEEIVVDKLKGLKIFGVSAVLIALFIGLYKYLRKKGKIGQAEKTAKTFIDKRTK